MKQQIFILLLILIFFIGQASTVSGTISINGTTYYKNWNGSTWIADHGLDLNNPDKYPYTLRADSSGKVVFFDEFTGNEKRKKNNYDE